VNGVSQETSFEIVKDPRTSGTLDDIKDQFTFLISVRDKLSETNKAIKNIRTAREQIKRVTDPLKDKEDAKPITDQAKTILDQLKTIEETLYQTKNKSGQDPLNYPIRLNNKLAALASESDGSDFRPTDQVNAVYQEVAAKIDEQLKGLEKIFKQDIPAFNKLVKEKDINVVTITE
jgi:hypothetical protein